jgi:hypothetical protein
MRASPLLVTLLGIFLLANILSGPTLARPASSSLLREKLKGACSFLKSLYNPVLQLVRTTPNNSVYYIASDNILAERAISYCDPTISRAINQSISSCCGTGYDLMHEALLGRTIPPSIHVASISTVANSTRGNFFNNITPSAAGGNYTVLWEKHNAPGIFPDCTYADVTVYAALELKLEGNTIGGQHEMDCLAIMFDGRGMVDEPYKNGSGSEHGIYQTYKLALYAYTLGATRRSPRPGRKSLSPASLLPMGVGDYACFSRFLKLGTVMPIILSPL